MLIVDFHDIIAQVARYQITDNPNNSQILVWFYADETIKTPLNAIAN